MGMRKAAGDEDQFAATAIPTSPTGMSINDSELQQMVEVATAYLDTGMVDEADDILQEALESGASSPAIEELTQRISVVRTGSDISMATRHIVPNGIEQVSRGPLVHLTAPLPGAERLSRSLQRVLAETERDFNEGRLHSALDLCFLAIADAPDFIPTYLRAAQIRIALGDIQEAHELVKTVERLLTLDDVRDDPMLQSLRVAMNPDDTVQLVSYARHLLDGPSLSETDPFVPAAIDATLESDPATAIELARSLVDRRPLDDRAVRIYVHSLIADGASDEVHAALKHSVRPESCSIDLLSWRAVAAMAAHESNWPEWLERVVELVRSNSESYDESREAFERSARFAPNDARHLASAVVALAAGRWEIAQGELEKWKIASSAGETSFERFVACAAQVEAIEFLALPGLVDALESLLTLSVVLDHEGISTECDLFVRRTGRSDVRERFRHALEVHGATTEGLEFLRSLLTSYPEDAGLRHLFADLLLEQNRVTEGLQELRKVAKSYESAGDLQSMAVALQRISQTVPQNVDVKQMLIDVYISRGIPDDALEEMVALGDIKHGRGDVEGAIEAYRQAAEVACSIGNFALGNELYDRVVDADPDNVPLRHVAAAFCLRNGAVSAAKEHLEVIVRISLADGDSDEAIAALHQIIGLAPHDFDAYHKLAETLTTLSEYGQAARVYSRLSDLLPDDNVLRAKKTALAVLAATE